MDPEAINRLWHEEACARRRLLKFHGPEVRCGCCLMGDCEFLCTTLVPYDCLPEQARKNGVTFIAALLDRFKLTDVLDDIALVNLASEVKTKLIRDRRDGSHGPFENCPECFKSFPDVCPSLHEYMGLKFEQLEPDVQHEALIEVRMLRQIIGR